MAQKVLDALKAKFGSAITHTESQHGDEIAVVAREQLVAIATWLKDDPAMLFDAPVFATAIDRLDWAGWTDEQPRFEACWQLRSGVSRRSARTTTAGKRRPETS